MGTNKIAKNKQKEVNNLTISAASLIDHVKKMVGKNQSKTKLEKNISSLGKGEKEIHIRYLGAGLLCMEIKDFEKHRHLWFYLLTNYPKELQIFDHFTSQQQETIEIDEKCYIRILRIAYRKKAFGEQNMHQVIDKLGQVIQTEHSARYVYLKIRELIRAEEEQAKDEI